MCRKSDPDTSTQTAGAETYVPQPRTNGWACPWNLYMVSVWGFIGLFSVFFFATQLPFLPAVPRYIFYCVGVAIFSCVIVSDVIAISIDSGDPLVSGGSSKNRIRPIFDRSQHKHVIENLYCNLCQSEVGHATKHCKTCDKCVSEFDHHCKWLNNCVGNRNYWAFFVCVSSGFVGSVLNLLGSLGLFVLFFASRPRLCWWDCAFPCSNQTNASVCIRLFHGEVPDPLFPVLMAVEFVLAVVAIGLLGQLYFFHLYLRLLGLSTFDYLNRKDEMQHEKLVKKHSEGSRGGTPNRPPSRNTIRSASSAKEVRVRRDSSDSETGSRGMDTHPRTPDEGDDTPSHIYTHQYALNMEQPIRGESELSRHVESIQMEVLPPEFVQSDEAPESSDISTIMLSGESDSRQQTHRNHIFNTSL